MDFEDSCIYKSHMSPIEFFDDLQTYVYNRLVNYQETIKNINIVDLKCLGDFQTEEEKAIEKEAIGKLREEMHKSLR